MLEPQHGKTALTVHRHLDEPLFGVRLGAHGGNGVVQRHAHDGAQLPDGEKAQHPAVRYTGDGNVLLLAFHGLGGEQGIQHRVAGLVLGLVLADVLLHGSNGGVLLGLVLLLPDAGKLDFQFMVPPVDEVDALLAALVLLVLAVQHLVHGGKLAVQSVLLQLLVLHR